MAGATPWRVKLQNSLSRNSHLVYSKYVQLATVRQDGRPANRTVVFRGFFNDTTDDRLMFVTDARSRKVQEVAHNPACELAWYFPESREQYRIAGKLAVVGAASGSAELAQARQAAWAAMSDAGRTQFTWPMPGLPRDPSPGAFAGPAPTKDEPAPAEFCLLLLTPAEVDYVQLFENYRATYTPVTSSEASEWRMVEVNP